MFWTAWPARRGSYLPLGSLGEFHRVGTQNIPGVRAAGPKIKVGPKPAGIIEAAGSNSHHIGTRGARREQRRSTLVAEAAPCNVAALGGDFVISRLAAHQPKGRCMHHHGWRISGAAGPLAVAAVAIHHRRRTRRTL